MIATLLLGLVLGGAFLSLMLYRDRTYVPSPPWTPQGTPNPEVAVVYYSRSGHSEAVAREVARRFNAPIARIDADYPLDWAGLRRAGSDAKTETLPPIRVEPLDLSRARRLFLVAPTWWFRPAAPLWAYLEQADLSGKSVVLVTTGNSRFEQTETDAFAARVAARGGRFDGHLFLRRGRILWQKTRDELLAETRDGLARFE